MADGTRIEWADASWNPLRARDKQTGRIGWFCTHASEGCRFCYAERFNRRLGTGTQYRAQDQGRVELFLDDKILAQPLTWKRPRRIFTLSMSDLFGEFVPDALIDRIWIVMSMAPAHTFLVLTKRSVRMRDYFCQTRPLPNVWLGVSAEDQATADARIPDLLATPAAKRFISAEPLLGPIDLGNLRENTFDALTGCGDRERLDEWEPAPGLDWVIVGGESGPGARPMHPAWPRALRDQCTAAGVPFFFKQWGEWLAGDDLPSEHQEAIELGARGLLTYADGKRLADGCEYEFHSDGSTLIRVGKRAAGRLLDGREWNEAPAS